MFSLYGIIENYLKSSIRLNYNHVRNCSEIIAIASSSSEDKIYNPFKKNDIKQT